MDNWEQKAKRFVWNQHKDQLIKSLARHPNSPEAERRRAELEVLNKKLEDLDSK